MQTKTHLLTRTRRIAAAAVMAALIFVITWLVHIPIPVSGGAYLNFGDAAVCVCAYIVGGPLGALSAGCGSALADIVGGAPAYVLPTFLIKAAMGLIVGVITTRPAFLFYLAACVTSGAVMAGGYYLFEYAAFGPAYAVSALPFNCIQWAGCVLIAVVLFRPARRLAATGGFRTSMRHEAGRQAV